MKKFYFGQVITKFNCNEGEAATFIELCRNAFSKTRNYDGCKSIDISIGQENSNLLVMTEKWESKKHHEAYLKFRTEDGTLAKLGAMLSGSLKISYLDLTDAQILDFIISF